MSREESPGERKPQEARTPRDLPVVLLAASAILLGHGVVLKAFSKNAGDVYMDEFFHERQTRHYCRGEFGVWDEKITTFPGLYLVATAWVKLLDLVPAWRDESALQAVGADPRLLFKLRLLISVINVATFCLLYRIYRFKKLSMASAATHALAWLLYPIIFFFGFLYYTDAGSLLLVLGMYDLAQRHRHLAAALAGSCAVIFRQTNAVWIAFVLGTSIVRDLAQCKDKDKRRPWWAEVDAREDLSLSMVGRFAGYLLHSWQRLLWLFWPYLVPLGAFAAFVVANGGSIVVGDRSNHKMTVHVAQVAYFLALCAGLHSPTSLLPSLLRFPSVLRRLGPLRVCVTAIVAAFLLDRYTLSHPFLVSDNRHYTFYLWQRVFQRIPHTNVLLLPVYAVCAWWVLSRLSTPCSPLIALVFMVALCLTLLPAHLLEPRYFTTPLVLASLEMPHPRPSASLLVTILGFMAVNAVTIYVFLYRPFVWNDGSTARFMW